MSLQVPGLSFYVNKAMTLLDQTKLFEDGLSLFPFGTMEKSFIHTYIYIYSKQQPKNLFSTQCSSQMRRRPCLFACLF